jgi:hypothetical protein
MPDSSIFDGPHVAPQSAVLYIIRIAGQFLQAVAGFGHGMIARTHQHIPRSLRAEKSLVAAQNTSMMRQKQHVRFQVRAARERALSFVLQCLR